MAKGSKPILSGHVPCTLASDAMNRSRRKGMSKTYALERASGAPTAWGERDEAVRKIWELLSERQTAVVNGF